MNGSMNATEQSQVESSLRASIKLNPNFAPSYDRLGAFLAMRSSNLDEARMMELNAVQLDPGNLNYRMTSANILLQMGPRKRCCNRNPECYAPRQFSARHRNGRELSYARAGICAGRKNKAEASASR